MLFEIFPHYGCGAYVSSRVWAFIFAARLGKVRSCFPLLLFFIREKLHFSEDFEFTWFFAVHVVKVHAGLLVTTTSHGFTMFEIIA